jgi:ribonuclease P protein component
VISDRRLPRAARIRDETSLQALQRSARVRGRWFVVAAMANGLDESRLAVRVAKKVVKSAVGRNRMRRCVREVFRHTRGQLGSSDFLVSLAKPYHEKTRQSARHELQRLLLQAAKR